MRDIEPWTIEKSKTLYGIDNWGGGYFSINNRGNISVFPQGQDGPEVDLHEVLQQVLARNIKPPVLFRFNEILRDRVRRIHQAFQDAIKEHEYEASYFPAYPIKVNQNRQVVEVLRDVGKDFSLGLEVGSKPELIAVLAMHKDPNALLLCNGYKDESYIELALMSRKVNRRPLIIIEKRSELELVLDTAKRLNVIPEIGFRCRLSGKGAGRWERSGGDRAKFGLTVGEILDCVKELSRREQLSVIKLVHFHVGSQVTAISSFKSALKEASQIYVQLKKHCPELSYLDVGGGLGVDYDGSKTNFESSMNYTLDEYARDIIWIVGDACERAEVTPPHIITEAGRATAAYNSILVFNVLGIANTFSNGCSHQDILEQSDNKIVRTMAELLAELTPKNCQETLHDAVGLRNDLLEQFNMGLISIEDRALGDKCYWALLNAICKKSTELNYIPEDLEDLPSILTDTYFCNLSVFQSLPDSWAIQQIFPITPVNRLNKEPTARVVLADITCDSDGKIDRFADLKDVKRYLPAHSLKEGEEYYFATFLVGAYQEILGDLHNLFGDTNVVHLETKDDGRVELSSVVHGDTVQEVLHYVQYDKSSLCEKWRRALESAVSSGAISPAESAEIFEKYSASFDGYTYLSVKNNS